MRENSWDRKQAYRYPRHDRGRGAHDAVSPFFVRTSKFAAISLGIEPAGEEKIKTTECCIDALLVGLYTLDLALFDVFMIAHELVVTACVFIAAAVQSLALLPLSHCLSADDQ